MFVHLTPMRTNCPDAKKMLFPTKTLMGSSRRWKWARGGPLSVGDQEETSTHTITKQIISRSLLEIM